MASMCWCPVVPAAWCILLPRFLAAAGIASHSARCTPLILQSGVPEEFTPVTTFLGFSTALFARHHRAAASAMLSDSDLRYVARCEKKRVDRNGSPLAILLLALPVDRSSTEETSRLERFLAARLRATDSAGRLNDGRIVVILPDTGLEGAWKVAGDICASYEAAQERPGCHVAVYPQTPPDANRVGGGLPRTEATLFPASAAAELF